jgi:uncharacterized protein
MPDKFFAAMVGVLPLPGSPRYAGSSKAVINNALEDLEQYLEAGADVVVLENSHDIPYIKPPLDPQCIALMKRIAKEARKRFDGPIGIQLLEAANESALEIACEADLDFLRVEGYVFAHIGGAGFIEGCAGRLLRKRAELGCNNIKIFGDVNKKHCSLALTADLDIMDVVNQAEFFLVDGIIVTGPRTRESPELKELKRKGTGQRSRRHRIGNDSTEHLEVHAVGRRLHRRLRPSGRRKIPRQARSTTTPGIRQRFSGS